MRAQSSTQPEVVMFQLMRQGLWVGAKCAHRDLDDVADGVGVDRVVRVLAAIGDRVLARRAVWRGITECGQEVDALDGARLEARVPLARGSHHGPARAGNKVADIGRCVSPAWGAAGWAAVL